MILYSFCEKTNNIYFSYLFQVTPHWIIAPGTSADSSREMGSKKYRLITLNVNGVVQTIRVPLDDDTQDNSTSPVLSSKQPTASTGIKRGLTASDILFSKKRKLEAVNKTKTQVTANCAEANTTSVINNSVSTQQASSGVNRPHTVPVSLTSQLTNTNTSTNVHNTGSLSVTRSPSIISSQLSSGGPAPPHNLAQYAQFQLPNNRHVTIQPAVNQGVASLPSISGTVNSNVSTSTQFQTSRVVVAPAVQPLTLFPSQTVQITHLQPPTIIEPNGNTTSTIQPTIIVPDDNTTPTAQPLTQCQSSTSIAPYENTTSTTQPLTLSQPSTIIVPDDNSTSTSQPLTLSQQPTIRAPDDNTTFTTQPLTLSQQPTIMSPIGNTTSTTQSLTLSQQPTIIVPDDNTTSTTQSLTLSQQPTIIVPDDNTTSTTQSLTLSQQPTIIVPDDNTTTTTQPLTLPQQPTIIAPYGNITPSTQPLTLSQAPTIIAPDRNTTSNTQPLTLSQQPTIIVPDDNSTSTSQPLTLSQQPTIIAHYGNTIPTTQAVTLSQPPNATVWPAGQILHNNFLSNIAGITCASMNATLAIPPQQMVAMTNQTTLIPPITPNTLLQPASMLSTPTTNTVLQQPSLLPTSTTVPQQMMMLTSTASNLSPQMFVLPTTQSTAGVASPAPVVPPNTVNIPGMIATSSVGLSTGLTAQPIVPVVTMVSHEAPAVSLPSQQSQNNTLPMVRHRKPVNSVAPIRNVKSAARVTKYPTLTTSTASATTQSTIILAKQATHHIMKSKTDPATIAKQMSGLVKAAKNNNRFDEARLLDSLSNSIVKKSKQKTDSRYVKILPMTNINTKYAAKVNIHNVKNVDKHNEKTCKDEFNKKTNELGANNEAVVQDTQPADSVNVVRNSVDDEKPKIEGKEMSWSTQCSNNNPFGVDKSARKKHKNKRKSKKKYVDETDIKPCSVVLNHINMYGEKSVKMWDILPQLYPDIFDADDN